VQIRAGAAQDVALAKQRRDIAGHVCQPQGLAAQQQMGDARMRRQLGHGLTVGGQRFAIQCAQAFSRSCAWAYAAAAAHRARPVAGRDAPARQLQARPARSEDFRTAVGGQLFVLILDHRR
jgi:hypothetical protein